MWQPFSAHNYLVVQVSESLCTLLTFNCLVAPAELLDESVELGEDIAPALLLAVVPSIRT